MTRLIVVLVGLVALMLLTVGMRKTPPRAELITAYVSLETLDAQVARAHDDIEAAYCLFEGLATFEPATFKIIPGVAESWDISDDGRVYTFHLRDDARWTDGSPVTAWDFRYAWHLGMLADTLVQYQHFLLLIKGAKDYAEWGEASAAAIVAAREEAEARGEDPGDRPMAMARQRRADAIERFDELVGVTVVDDRTLVVELEQPTPYFEEIVSTWAMIPLHQPTIEAATTIDPGSYRLRRDTQWTKPGRLVGNGPYRLVDWQFKRSVRMEASEYYWNREAVGPQTLEMRNFQDYNTAFIAYESGQIDYIPQATPVTFNAELMEAYRNGERDDVHPVTAFGIYYYVINCRPRLPDGRDNPFTDPRLRQALSLSVERTQLVEKVTRLFQPTSDVFVPRDVIPGYESPQGLGEDVRRAQRLIAEAGYPGGQGLSIQILYNTGGGHEPVAQAVQRMWEENLGIDVKLDGQEWKVFLDNRNRGQYTIARSGWFGDYSDPTTFLELFQSDNGNNDAGIRDERYDEMLERAATITDRRARLDLLSEAEGYMIRDVVPVVPLYQYMMFDLIRPSEYANYETSSRNLHQFYRVQPLRR